MAWSVLPASARLYRVPFPILFKVPSIIPHTSARLYRVPFLNLKALASLVRDYIAFSTSLFYNYPPTASLRNLYFKISDIVLYSNLKK